MYHGNCDSQAKRENLTVKYSRDGFAEYSSIHVADIADYLDMAILGDELCVLYEVAAPYKTTSLYLKMKLPK